MNNLKMTTIAAAICVAFSTGAIATDMSKDQYKSAGSAITGEFKSAKVACNSFSANAKDVCMAEAKGKESVAKAELEAGYKPTTKNQYNVSIARAKADYSVAKEKCDDKAGNEKDVCIKQAKAAQTAANADARTWLKTTDANRVASDKTAAARTKANEKGSAARQDAATEKRNAEYAVAKEKCDTFAGDAKDVCVKEARVRFGQS